MFYSLPITGLFHHFHSGEPVVFRSAIAASTAFCSKILKLPEDYVGYKEVLTDDPILSMFPVKMSWREGSRQ